MIKFPRRLRKPSEINIAPFVDVVFLLLIFFVVPATFQTNANLIVDLPAIDDEDLVDQENSSLTLVIRKDSSFYFDQELLSFEDSRELSSLITLHLDGLSHPAITIAADELAPHRSVVLAIEAARRSGFERIFLQASHEEQVLK